MPRSNANLSTDKNVSDQTVLTAWCAATVQALHYTLQACNMSLCLQAEAQAGHQLLERWGTRNEAIAQLEAVIEGVSGPVASQISPARGLEGMPSAAV